MYKQINYRINIGKQIQNDHELKHSIKGKNTLLKGKTSCFLLIVEKWETKKSV